MGWFRRRNKGITTRVKKDPPDIWYKCPNCKTTIRNKEHTENAHVCSECEYHTRIGSNQYFDLLYDNQEYEILFDELKPKDILGFTDLKAYNKRLIAAQDKTDLNDALQVGIGAIKKRPLVIAAMDFSFIGGSMGSVVGEKIAKAIDYCIEHRYPLLIISKSGGARMMESAFALMQMAKTSAKLSQLAQHQLPYISLMTDPTTGGVTASFAMLGDINIAEPKALIGFAGPRVIKDTIKRDLPEGFQSSEFVKDHGFLDKIVDRRELKNELSTFMQFFE